MVNREQSYKVIDEIDACLMYHKVRDATQLRIRMQEFFLVDDEEIKRKYYDSKLSVMFAVLTLFIPEPPERYIVAKYLNKTINCLYDCKRRFKDSFKNDENFRKSVMTFTSFHCTPQTRSRLIKFIGKY